MWMNFITSYLLLELLAVAGIVGFTVWMRTRRLAARKQGPPPGFVRTDEVFTDPTTNRRQHVWFNPQTGERYYETVE